MSYDFASSLHKMITFKGGNSTTRLRVMPCIHESLIKQKAEVITIMFVLFINDLADFVSFHLMIVTNALGLVR